MSDGDASSRWTTIWKGLCPRCRRGRIFAGVVRMNDRCPSCRVEFSREPGYFSGAMYVSYGLGIGLLLLFFGAATLAVPHWSATARFAAAGILFLPFIPAVFRYSRILWIHLDRHLEP